jgi:cytochrome c-type biogenesis protein
MDSIQFIPIILAGVFIFISPCTLPLVPAYLGMITGNSIDELNEKSPRLFSKTMLNALLFVLGFSLVFITFGILAELLFGFQRFRSIFTQISGLLLIAFSLNLMGVSKIPFLNKTLKFKPPTILERGNPMSSFMIGIIFAAGWSPCVGPVIIALLGLISTTSTLAQGIVGLVIFCLGLAIPFLVTAAATSFVLPKLKNITKHLKLINYFGGLLLLYIGILLLANKFSVILAQGYKLLEFIGIDYSFIEKFL